MKIAFVDNLAVGGGLSRFSLLLCRSLIEAQPEMEIHYFVHHSNLNHIPEIKYIPRVKVEVLDTTCPPTLYKKLICKCRIWIKLKTTDDPVIKEIRKKIDERFTLAYFPSAHMMERPILKIPIVGTIHDFNWKYFFGRQIFSTDFIGKMDIEILKWLNGGPTICSSHDVVAEAKKLYPNVKNYPKVSPIAPVVVNQQITSEKAEAILQELCIDYPYLIFPGNFFPHKNHLNLFTAFYLLKQRKGMEHVKLLLTGMNSDQLAYGKAEYRGVQLITNTSLSSTDFDIRGLGYQPNEVMDALISKAQLLVSPSIYEAICTPAMDAWSYGTPTAISDIPPYREHESAWNIRSSFFNPMDPMDIANKLELCLNNYEKTKSDGLLSQQNMHKYDWGHVTRAYLNIFNSAIKDFKK